MGWETAVELDVRAMEVGMTAESQRLLDLLGEKKVGGGAGTAGRGDKAKVH